jgi:hypothetical protein
VFLTIFLSRFVFYAFQLIFTLIVFGLLAAADADEIESRTFVICFVVFWLVSITYTLFMPWIDKNVRIVLGIFSGIILMLYINALQQAIQAGF